MAAGKQMRVALIGAGFIADVHLQVLARLDGVKTVALCDPARARAERLARRHGVPNVFDSVQDLLQWGELDAVHVLVPPELHAEVARQCLEAGVHVLMEKPMTLLAAETAQLEELARERSLVIAVNHNLTFHPAVLRLKQDLKDGRMGRLEHLVLVHNVPLRQLGTGDFGHFMFRTEANMVWEQGVHLFSLVEDLLGAASEVHARTGPPLMLSHGVRFFDTWNVEFTCARGTAQVRMAFGRTMPESSLCAIASDAVATLDLLRGGVVVQRKTRWLDAVDTGRNLVGAGLGRVRDGIGAVLGYAASLFRLRQSADPYIVSMRGSAAAFRDAVAGHKDAAPCSAQSAREVLAMCERVADAAGASRQEPERPAIPEPGPARPGEVVVTGGTGFMGRQVVQQLLDAERPVTLLVRRPHLLPASLRDGRVRIFVGDAADGSAMDRVLAGSDALLHLATCAGDDPAQIERAMAAAAKVAAEACRKHGVRRMVYTSSTAALYLGGRVPVPGSVGPDGRPRSRAEYSRGKIAAENELRHQMSRGLEAVIVRPAIVVGTGGQPDHSGAGLWMRDNHCVGWGGGKVPLPFVLVEDCARALVACVDAEAAAGRSYNLAGDVRPTAREYLALLRERTGRDYQFHPQWLWWMWGVELGKWGLKVLARRPGQFPSLRDFRSRGFFAPLDCSDAKRDLDWQPETDRERFLAAAVDVHLPG